MVKLLYSNNDVIEANNIPNEHKVYTFYISDISRSLLQENSRHRCASPSVKSSRYTLKELKEVEPFDITEISRYKSNPHINIGDVYLGTNVMQRAAKYLRLINDFEVDVASVLALENLRGIIASGKPNDKAKYCMPENYKTELTWTVGYDCLRNFLKLRTDKSALWEIRILAYDLYYSLPTEWRNGIAGVLYKDTEYKDLVIPVPTFTSDENIPGSVIEIRLIINSLLQLKKELGHIALSFTPNHISFRHVSVCEDHDKYINNNTYISVMSIFRKYGKLYNYEAFNNVLNNYVLPPTDPLE